LVSGIFPDATYSGIRDGGQMRGHDRYAVVFRESGRENTAGSLELRRDALLLSGGSQDEQLDLSVPFGEVVEVHIGRNRSERLNGYPTLVVERGDAPIVLVAPLGASLLHEIADLLIELTERQPDQADTLTVSVPLRPGCLEQARSLLAQAPPLDPARLGLTSHQVYLHDDEALFVFTGPDVHARVRRAMRSPRFWRAGLAWRDCIAGQPEIRTAPDPALEDPVYSWTAETET
jgi:hypothetical protein